jgi:hypothetical protein
MRSSKGVLVTMKKNSRRLSVLGLIALIPAFSLCAQAALATPTYVCASITGDAAAGDTNVYGSNVVLTADPAYSGGGVYKMTVQNATVALPSGAQTQDADKNNFNADGGYAYIPVPLLGIPGDGVYNDCPAGDLTIEHVMFSGLGSLCLSGCQIQN